MLLMLTHALLKKMHSATTSFAMLPIQGVGVGLCLGVNESCWYPPADTDRLLLFSKSSQGAGAWLELAFLIWH